MPTRLGRSPRAQACGISTPHFASDPLRVVGALGVSTITSLPPITFEGDRVGRFRRMQACSVKPPFGRSAPWFTAGHRRPGNGSTAAVLTGCAGRFLQNFNGGKRQKACPTGITATPPGPHATTITPPIARFWPNPRVSGPLHTRWGSGRRRNHRCARGGRAACRYSSFTSK